MKYTAPAVELMAIMANDVITASNTAPVDPDKPGLGEEERE